MRGNAAVKHMLIVAKIQQNVLTIQKKADAYLTSGNAIKFQAAKRLADNLDKSIKEYSNNNNTTTEDSKIQVFTKNCHQAIKNEKNTLNSATWTSLFQNIAVTLSGIGTIPGLISCVHFLITGKFLFFKSESEKLISTTEKDLAKLTTPRRT
jgi:hypothetical protein